MELTYNKPLKIMRFIDSDLMELEDGSIVKFLAKRPESWKPGNEVILRKNTDPKPGGPRQMQFNTVVTATNVKGGEPQPVTFVKSLRSPVPSSSVKENYSIDDVKIEKKYVVLEEYPDEDSFLLECGKFLIDRTMDTLLYGKFECHKNDEVVLKLIAVVLNNKKKFKIVNLSQKNQEGAVLFNS